MPRVIGLDIHRDFAQAVALDGDKLIQLGRVQLDRESFGLTTRSFSKQQPTRSR
jgi:hypothetical protein